MNNTSLYIYQIKGDLASQKASEAKNDLLLLLEQGKKNISLDCTQVSQVDVVGVNSLAIFYKNVRNEGGSMEIKLKKDSQLSKMLHLTKFEKIFTLIYQ